MRCLYDGVRKCFLIYETDLFYFLYFYAGKFCLAHRLGQLTRDINCNVRILNFRSDVTYALPRETPNDVHRKSLCDLKCHL